MTLDEFDTLLCLHGSDLKKWPEDQRMVAENFLVANENAVTLLDEMKQLDGLVLSSTQATIPTGVIAAQLQERFHYRRETGWFRALLSPRGILALGSFGGIGGVAAATIAPVATDASVLLALALGGMFP